uniref:Uncharacterized protein n=1 Tax=Setaria italica TaxID=4555 RepID=K4A490_SETIT
MVCAVGFELAAAGIVSQHSQYPRLTLQSILYLNIK